MPKRRGHGEGSIYQRKDGRWCASYITGRAPDGRLKRGYIYGDTRAEVAAELTKVLAKKIDGLPVDVSKQTVGEYLAGWLEDVAKDTVRATTHSRYESLISANIKPALGGIRLDKLAPQHLQRFYRETREKGLARTACMCHGLLHRALGQAMKWGLVPRNVADLVDAPKIPQTEMQVLTPEEVARFLDAAREDRLYGLYALAVTTGLREAELLGLRWQDVDMQNGVLQVHHQLQWRKRKRGEEDKHRKRMKPVWVLTEPKSAKGRRAIVLPAIARAALKQHRVRQAQERLALGEAWEDLDFVFPTAIGTPKDGSHLRREFHDILQRAGLPKIRFHDLRHVAATLMLRAGVPLKVVSETLGHATVGITADRYAHVLQEMREEAAAKMDTLFSGLGTSCSRAQS
ncbi:MAG: site-specific integrase [Bacillota bacterium]|nr:site-specific integrase [Bacillota bacterium]